MRKRLTKNCSSFDLQAFVPGQLIGHMHCVKNIKDHTATYILTVQIITLNSREQDVMFSNGKVGIFFVVCWRFWLSQIPGQPVISIPELFMIITFR